MACRATTGRATYDLGRVEIALFDHRPVVDLVADDDVRDRAHGELAIASDAAMGPHRVVETPERSDVGLAHRVELVHELGERPGGGVGASRIIHLVEAGQVCGILPCETVGSITEHPFHVDDVPDDFFDAPFPFGITVARLLGVRARNRLEVRVSSDCKRVRISPSGTPPT